MPVRSRLPPPDVPFLPATHGPVPATTQNEPRSSSHHLPPCHKPDTHHLLTDVRGLRVPSPRTTSAACRTPAALLPFPYDSPQPALSVALPPVAAVGNRPAKFSDSSAHPARPVPFLHGQKVPPAISSIRPAGHLLPASSAGVPPLANPLTACGTLPPPAAFLPLPFGPVHTIP